MHLEAPLNDLEFAIVTSDPQLVAGLELFITRTYLGSVVHRFDPSLATPGLEACRAAFIVNDCISSDKLSEIREANPAGKLVLITPYSNDTEGTSVPGYDGHISAPAVQRDVRELLRRMLALPEKLPLAGRLVKPEDILYCQGGGLKTIVCTGAEKLVHNTNLGRVATLLTPYGHVRINRSAIINRRHNGVEAVRHETIFITMADGKRFKITEPHEDDFMDG